MVDEDVRSSCDSGIEGREDFLVGERGTVTNRGGRIAGAALCRSARADGGHWSMGAGADKAANSGGHSRPRPLHVSLSRWGDDEIPLVGGTGGRWSTGVVERIVGSWTLRVPARADGGAIGRCYRGGGRGSRRGSLALPSSSKSFAPPQMRKALQRLRRAAGSKRASGGGVNYW